MPAKPIAPMPSVSHTGLRLKSRSSRIASGRGAFMPRGSTRIVIATVASAITLTSANAQRQPNTWPSHVASGLPTSSEIDRPSMTRPTAVPRCSGGLMRAATSAAMPK